MRAVAHIYLEHEQLRNLTEKTESSFFKFDEEENNCSIS